MSYTPAAPMTDSSDKPTPSTTPADPAVAADGSDSSHPNDPVASAPLGADPLAESSSLSTANQAVPPSAPTAPAALGGANLGEGKPESLSAAGLASSASGSAPDQDSLTTDAAERRRPTFLFFGVVASLSLVLDVVSKSWAAVKLGNGGDPIVVIDKHLNFTWALNKGGAWGILQDSSEYIRKPFFFVVSALAIGFIVSLYKRLTPEQRALKWGLPLVLGGALGNLADRIIRGKVIDFIDYRADWIASFNAFIKRRISDGWSVTDHWPTFNVADIAICIGVLLMAVDMVTSRKRSVPVVAAASETDAPQADPPASSALDSGDTAPPGGSSENAAPAPH